MSIRTGWILCAAGAAVLSAQQGSIGGPVAGYVFDARSHSLRPIRGIPGAALIGEPVDLGASVTSAWVAPKQDTALAIAADGAAHLYRLDAGKATARDVAGLVAPERAIYSPSGTALALVTPGSVRIISGLPDAPVVAGTIELPVDRVPATAAMSAKLRRPGGGTVSVSDDGAYLLYGSTGSIELLGLKGDSRKLSAAGPGALTAFAPGAHDAVVVDAQTVALFTDVAGAATVRKLPGIAGARDAVFSPDAHKLFVAAASLTALDVATGDRTAIDCNCRPSTLARMGNAYRLTELGPGPLWLLDATTPEPKVVFVPAM